MPSVKNHVLATSGNPEVLDPMAMSSDRVQEFLARAGDAHTTAMSSLKTNYEAQICGLQEEVEAHEAQLQRLRQEVATLQQQSEGKGTLEATDRKSILQVPRESGRKASRNLTSTNSVTFAKEVEDTTGSEAEADPQQMTAACSSISVAACSVSSEVVNVRSAIASDSNGEDLVDAVRDKSVTLNVAVDKTLSLRPGGTGSPPGSLSPCSRVSDGSNINRNMNLRKQWTDHPEQDEEDLLAEMLHKATQLDGELSGIAHHGSIPESGSRLGPGCAVFIATPGAVWRLCWDLSGAVLIGFDTIMIPFTLAFNPGDNDFFTMMNWATMLFWTMDMILTFFVGYVTKSGQTRMSFSSIAKRYMQTWFILDLVVVLGDWFNNVGEEAADSGKGGVGSTAKLMRSLRTVRVLRLLRLLKLKRVLTELQDRISSESTYLFLSLVRLLFFIIFLNHLISCGWYALGAKGLATNDVNWITANKCENRELGYKYTISLHWTLSQFTPASMEVFPQNTAERTMCVVVLMLALGVFSSFLASISTSMTALRNMNADVNKQFWMLRRYLNQNKVSKLMARRILKYLEFVLQKEHGQVQAAKVTILNLLSQQLREEMTYELMAPKINGMIFFEHFSAFPLMDVVVRKICTAALKSIIIASGDHLFYPGDEASFVYCFLNGNMGYFLEDSKPIDPPVAEQEWIAEAAFWVPWKYVGRFAAQAESELITIDIGQFIRHVSRNILSWKTASRYGEIFIHHVKGSPRLSDIMRDEVMIDSLKEDLNHEHFKHGVQVKIKPAASWASDLVARTRMTSLTHSASTVAKRFRSSFVD